MNLRERYFILDLYSKIMTLFWIPFLIAVMFFGLAFGWQFGFIFGVFNAFLFGLVIGLPMILFGQAAGAFLDQAEVLMGMKEQSDDHI